MLEEILRQKEQEIEQLKRGLLIDRILPRKKRFRMRKILNRKDRDVAVIAEIKAASPSKGILCEHLEPEALAKEYEENGAAVISVLTDEKFFHGKAQYLPDVRRIVGVPLLRKDFILDAVQLYETVVLGADLVLLIAALHPYGQLLGLVEKCNELGLEPLVEVHTREELLRVRDLPVEIVGINNRNLKDFTVNIRTSLDLAPLIPSAMIKVSESGISSREDVRLLADSGFDAVLVGEALVRSSRPGKKLRELAGGPVERGCTR